MINKNVIESNIDKKEFKIGHHASKSETFLPNFYKVEETDSMFVDLAGLDDTGGNFISLVNCFISKFIFENAKTVRFLVPFTQVAIKDGRGSHIRDLLRTIQHVCSQELNTVIEAIQPVMTQIKPDEDNDVDIDEIRQTISQ